MDGPTDKRIDRTTHRWMKRQTGIMIDRENKKTDRQREKRTKQTGRQKDAKTG